MGLMRTMDDWRFDPRRYFEVGECFSARELVWRVEGRAREGQAPTGMEVKRAQRVLAEWGAEVGFVEPVGGGVEWRRVA